MKSWYNQIKDTGSFSCSPYFLFSSVQENKTYHTTDLKHFLFSNLRRSIEWYSVYLQCLSVSFWLIGFSVSIKNVLWVITLIKIHIYFAALHLSYIFLPQVRQKWNGIWCINLYFYSKNFIFCKCVGRFLQKESTAGRPALCASWPSVCNYSCVNRKAD